MKLSSLLSPDQIILDMRATERSEAILELVNYLESSDLLKGETKAAMVEALNARENQNSTGIGSGVAIPHTFSENIERVICVFGRSFEGIEFDALDNAPVKYVVLFIVPKADYQKHLQTLAAIAKLFTNCEVRKALTAAKTKSDILQIFASRPSRVELEK